MKEILTPEEMGRRGGNTTKERYGPDHFKKIGQKGGAACKANNGSDHYKRMGAIGGQKSSEKLRVRVKLAWQLLKEHEAKQESRG